MTLKEIYETDLKNKELVELLRDNGWGMLDLLNWVAFAKANGQIK